MNRYLDGAHALSALESLRFYEDEGLPDDPNEVADLVVSELEESPPFVPPPEVKPYGGRVIQSALENVSDRAWTDFVLAMKIAEPSAVSSSNALGMFELKPRRLADLGLVKNVAAVTTRSPHESSRRMLWAGEWVSPMTQDKFLASPRAQYAVFAESMKRYVDAIDKGEIEVPVETEELTLSAGLAVLHRGGPHGLVSWSQGERFPLTVALVERTNELF